MMMILNMMTTEYTNLSNQTKPSKPYKTFQTKPTLPNQTYQTKPKKPNLPIPNAPQRLIHNIVQFGPNFSWGFGPKTKGEH